jgi:hypothetical protein
MKRIIIILVSLAVFISCGRKHKNKKEIKEERIEVVPFFTNVVYTQDLHIIDTNLYLVEPQEFLSKAQFKVFTDAIWTMIRNPKSRLFDDPDQICTEQSLKDRFRRCDTLVQSSFNAEGEEIITAVWACDTASIVDNASRIEFYESWYLNTKTNLIEKETLGYTLWSYVPDKEAFRQMFIVFRDDKAMEKCKRFEFAD